MGRWFLTRFVLGQETIKWLGIRPKDACEDRNVGVTNETVKQRVMLVIVVFLIMAVIRGNFNELSDFMTLSFQVV